MTNVKSYFCFVRQKQRLGRTYVLSRKKNYLQPCTPKDHTKGRTIEESHIQTSLAMRNLKVKTYQLF